MDEVKHRSGIVAECHAAIQRRIEEIDKLNRFDISIARSIMTVRGIENTLLCDELLREVIDSGIAARRVGKLSEISELEGRIVNALIGEQQ
jgi:hypothetical protein